LHSNRDPETLQILKENMARLGVGIATFFDHEWTAVTSLKMPRCAIRSHPGLIALQQYRSNATTGELNVDCNQAIFPAAQRQLKMLPRFISLLEAHVDCLQHLQP